jgi:hypothetical protein
LPIVIYVDLVLLKIKVYTRAKIIIIPRDTKRRGRLGTVYLLLKVTCFVKKVNNIFNIKQADPNIRSLIIRIRRVHT